MQAELVAQDEDSAKEKKHSHSMTILVKKPLNMSSLNKRTHSEEEDPTEPTYHSPNVDPVDYGTKKVRVMRNRSKMQNHTHQLMEKRRTLLSPVRRADPRAFLLRITIDNVQLLNCMW